MHCILSNLYYKGQVAFQGAAYDGLYAPLMSKDYWYRVRATLSDHHLSCEKP